MIRKSGDRFSEKIMLTKQPERQSIQSETIALKPTRTLSANLRSRRSRHCERSGAIQSSASRGLLLCSAPCNDEAIKVVLAMRPASELFQSHDAHERLPRRA